MRCLLLLFLSGNTIIAPSSMATLQEPTLQAVSANPTGAHMTAFRPWLPLRQEHNSSAQAGSGQQRLQRKGRRAIKRRWSRRFFF